MNRRNPTSRQTNNGELPSAFRPSCNATNGRILQLRTWGKPSQPNATAAELKAALEGLQNVAQVDVFRESTNDHVDAANPDGGYTWLVTFLHDADVRSACQQRTCRCWAWTIRASPVPGAARARQVTTHEAQGHQGLCQPLISTAPTRWRACRRPRCCSSSTCLPTTAWLGADQRELVVTLHSVVFVLHDTGTRRPQSKNTTTRPRVPFEPSHHSQTTK